MWIVMYIDRIASFSIYWNINIERSMDRTERVFFPLHPLASPSVSDRLITGTSMKPFDVWYIYQVGDIDYRNRTSMINICVFAFLLAMLPYGIASRVHPLLDTNRYTMVGAPCVRDEGDARNHRLELPLISYNVVPRTRSSFDIHHKPANVWFRHSINRPIPRYTVYGTQLAFAFRGNILWQTIINSILPEWVTTGY